MITVIIHTRNEEKNIQACINSAKILSDTIVVIDMASTDTTSHIVQQNKVKLVSFPFSHYVEPARAFGIEQATSPWVMILDADERVTSKLAQEIKTIVHMQRAPSQPTHYYIPRKNIFGNTTCLPAGRWLKHGDWWPDKQIRFINKSFLKEWPSHIHSTPVMDGSHGTLKNSIEHYFHGDLEDMVKKTIVYEDIESDLLLQAKRPVSVITFFRKFIGELNRRLIIKMGFLDGSIGAIESMYQAYSKTITYLFLYEKYYHKKSSTV